MFSERIIDDVEKKKERDAKDFFLYPARKKKDGSVPSFEEKWKRGSPKDLKWCNRQYVSEMWADFARIQNEVLEQNGFSIRVDHRTLQAQKEEAEQNDDTFLARLFSRVPEEYVGIISYKEDDDEKVERLREFRSLSKQHFDLVMKLDAISKETEELKTKDAVQLASTAAKSLMDTKEYAEQKFASQPLLAMKNKILTAVAEDEELVRGVNSKIFSLLTSARAMKKSVENIKCHLEQPEFKNNILMVTHQILQANSHARKMLKQASEDFSNASFA